MRTIAVTTQRGIARVITRLRLPQPQLFQPSSGNPRPPSAASLTRLAHMTTANDQTNDLRRAHALVEPQSSRIGLQRTGAKKFISSIYIRSQ